MRRVSTLFESFRSRDAHKVGSTLAHESRLEAATAVELVLTYSDGRVEVLPLGSNVVTNLGRSNMAHLVAGDEVADRKVVSVKFGDGGHSPSSPTTPLIPTVADTALYGNTIIEKAVSYSFPDGASGTKVLFSATVGESEGNGTGSQAYSEVGLYDLSGRMMTHKCFGLITKSNAFSMTLRYTILL